MGFCTQISVNILQLSINTVYVTITGVSATETLGNMTKSAYIILK